MFEFEITMLGVGGGGRAEKLVSALKRRFASDLFQVVYKIGISNPLVVCHDDAFNASEFKKMRTWADGYLFCLADNNIF